MSNLIPVNSSNISAVGYDAETRTLTVQFKSGASHAYQDVPPETARDMLAAPSVGKFFHAHVRSAYGQTRVE